MENDGRHWFGGRASKWIDDFIKVVQKVNSITALCMYMYSTYVHAPKYPKYAHINGADKSYQSKVCSYLS